MTKHDATQILTAVSEGDEKAAEELMPMVYESVRERADALLRQERAGHTLDPTALVHEAYVRLVDHSKIDWKGRTHFLAMAAKTMRRVLVDHARRKGSQKRGGHCDRITLSELVELEDSASFDVLELHEALEKLAIHNEDHARIVEMRFFSGMNLEEIGTVLGVTPRTLKRHWRLARAWLLGELTEGEAQ